MINELTSEQKIGEYVDKVKKKKENPENEKK